MRFACLLPLLAGCAAAPQIDLEAETAAVRARSEGIAAAEAAMDAEAAIAFWAEDAIVQQHGAPQIQGRGAIMQVYDQFMSSGAVKQFEGTTMHLDVAASGDVAWEYGVNRFVLAGPEGDLLDVGKYLAIWKKVNGEWFIVALSFTSDSPQPVPAAAQ